ncbi:hypothetical protein C8Q78DRAFT_661381 [Trametes maxima]|nr:hypothetical protein C8Q78DRAFT_661381 [Trametes maxima]
MSICVRPGYTHQSCRATFAGFLLAPHHLPGQLAGSERHSRLRNMSKQAVDPVEEPEIDEGEESDEYDIEEEEGESGVFEGEDEEGDEEAEGASGQGSSLTALLLGGEAAVAEEGEGEEEDDDDEEYQDGDNVGDVSPMTAAPTAGTKRGREDDEPSGESKISGDYGEFQEAEEGIAKRARTAADAELAAAEEEDEEV